MNSWVAKYSELLNDPDIDLIVGSHVHVVQPIDTINQKPVIYGLGNFLSNQSTNCCPDKTQNGVIVFVEIAGVKGEIHQVRNISITPTRVNRSDFTIIPLPLELKNEEINAYIRNLYQAAINETASVINMFSDSYLIRD